MKLYSKFWKRKARTETETLATIKSFDEACAIYKEAQEGTELKAQAFEKMKELRFRQFKDG